MLKSTKVADDDDDDERGSVSAFDTESLLHHDRTVGKSDGTGFKLM